MKARFLLACLLFSVAASAQSLSTDEVAELRQRADRGFAPAQWQLGLSYQVGSPEVPQYFGEAVKWYRSAAEQGNEKAQNSLGTMYDSGQGVPQDFREATKWYRLGAEQGNSFAQFNLGKNYYSGEGVPQDYVQAHRWLNLAASQESGGFQEIWAEARDAAAAKMTPDQIAEAQRLAREWKPKTWEELKPDE